MIKRFILNISLAATLLTASIAQAQSSTYVENPLNAQFSSVPAFVEGALKVMVMVSLPIITLFIVYSGFMFVMAQGNEGKLQDARRNFFYVIVGSILLLGAWVIATLIGGTISQLTK
jgi:hypothetical protein